jgi:hypothetical protein
VASARAGTSLRGKMTVEIFGTIEWICQARGRGI